MRRKWKENISPTATSAARLWPLFRWIKVAYSVFFYSLTLNWMRQLFSQLKSQWNFSSRVFHFHCSVFRFSFVEMWNVKKNKRPKKVQRNRSREKKSNWDYKTNKLNEKNKRNRKKREFPGGKKRKTMVNEEKAKCSNGPINHLDRQ